MARFIPPLRATSPRSNAERRVLEWLQLLPDAWTVIHSLGILNHPFKRWAEIDVLLIGSRGVLALEIKGGRVLRREGLWGFQDRYGAVTWKREGPFDQAGQAEASLRRSLTQTGALGQQHCSGYAVVLPDAALARDWVGVNANVLLDPAGSWANPAHTLNSWCSYWAQRTGRRGHLDSASIQRIVEALAPDVELAPALSLLASDVRRDLTRLTNEQTRVLSAARLNPRLIITGRAGTGKTMLALHEVQSLAEEHSSTLLVCPNLTLATLSREALGDTEGVTVATAGEAVRTRSGSDFEAVVIDEAQDFMSSLPRIVETRARGGISGGSWRVFFDPAQALIAGNEQLPAPEINRAAASLRLTLNCRNTRQIAVFTSLLTRMALDVEAPVEGPPVHELWWSDANASNHSVAEELGRLSAELTGASIALLTQERLSVSAIQDLSDRAGVSVHSLGDAPATGVVAASIGDFKGLEADAVLVAGATDLNSSTARQHLYVACTRARVQLSILLHESMRDYYQASAKWFGQQLVSRNEKRMSPLSEDASDFGAADH